MVSGNRKGCVVSKEADDVQVGHARLDHHDVCPLRLIQTGLPEGLPVVGGVLLVGLLIGRNDAPFLACASKQGEGHWLNIHVPYWECVYSYT